MSSKRRIEVKAVLCGSWVVGKTTLRRKYMGETFVQDHLQTVGADFSVSKVDNHENTIVELQIWDLAGAAGFESLRQHFFKGSLAAIMVFDLNRPETFKELDSWFEQLWRGGQDEAMPITILGNRVNTNKTRVSEEEVMEFIEKLKKEHRIQNPNISYITTSLETGENINLAFYNLAKSFA